MQNRRSLGFLCLFLLMSWCTLHADTLLVGAPTEAFAAWVTQSGVPPTPPTYNYAAEFSLSSNQFVTHIDVPLYGYAGNSITSFRLSLQDSLTGSPNVFAGSDLSFATGGGSEVLNSLTVNSNLNAGTYFLVLTADMFVGWIESDGNYVETAGTVTNGTWEYVPLSQQWVFLAGSFNAPGAFSVYGPDVQTPVPEPASLLLLATGVLPALWRRRA